MNLEKLYQEMGGDMADAVRRLGSIATVSYTHLRAHET